MARESMEHIGAVTDAHARTSVRAAQDVAERAGAYMQDQLTRLSDRAQDLAHNADDLVKAYTGRSLEAWTGDVREFVRSHPLQILGATIALGYVLGKLTRRGA